MLHNIFIVRFYLHWYVLFLDSTFRMHSVVARSCHAHTRFTGNALLQWYRTACKCTSNVAIFLDGSDEVFAWSFRIFSSKGQGLIIRAREGQLQRNNNLARAANEITDMRIWWNALSCGVCASWIPNLLGHFTLSQFLLSPSNHCQTIPAGACSLASPVSKMWLAFMHAFTNLKDLTVVLFASYSRTNCPVCRHPLYSQDWPDSRTSAQRDIWQKFAFLILITSCLLRICKIHCDGIFFPKVSVKNVEIKKTEYLVIKTITIRKQL